VTIDQSLKKPSGIVRVRNVLKRAERIVILKEQDRWVEGNSTALGLPKVRIKQTVVGKKKKVKEEEPK
jgi:small basic protein (TIGR04137 family)